MILNNLLDASISPILILFKVSYKTTCPVTFNETNQTESATKAAINLLGKDT